MPSIQRLLHRRNDLGTFLAHLTRVHSGQDARSNLLSILLGRRIEARTPMGVGNDYWDTDAAFGESQKTVCFTETPLEHVWMMCEDIDDRAVNMQPYGVVFTKTWGRRHEANPVMYADITVGHDWLTKYLGQLLTAAAAGQAPVHEGDNWVVKPLAECPISRITPFVEPMGKPGLTRREWWWEREWRKVGDLTFMWNDLVAVLVPEEDHGAFKAEFDEKRKDDMYVEFSRPIRYLDPRWGQERMIAALAEVSANNVGPFPD